jgi:hypothetical protein
LGKNTAEAFGQRTGIFFGIKRAPIARFDLPKLEKQAITAEKPATPKAQQPR